MITWRQFFALMGGLAIFAAIFIFARVAHGYAPTQYYQASWEFNVDSGGYLTATVDGFNYGRVAPGTYYSYPVSFLNPDRIFVVNFEGPVQGAANKTK